MTARSAELSQSSRHAGTGKDAVTDALVEMLVTTRYEDLAASTVEAVRRSVLDLVGCMLGAAQVSECDAVLRSAGKTRGDGARVFGRKDRLDPSMAAFVNATAGRALDMDDLYEPGQLHATVAVVPVILAIADTIERPITGKEFVAATVTAVDLLARLSPAVRRPGFSERSPAQPPPRGCSAAIEKACATHWASHWGCAAERGSRTLKAWHRFASSRAGPRTPA
jgi:hypothetical protein